MPALVFVSETEMEGKKVAELTHQLGFEGCLLVSISGLSGGLNLFWLRWLMLHWLIIQVNI